MATDRSLAVQEVIRVATLCKNSPWTVNIGDDTPHLHKRHGTYFPSEESIKSAGWDMDDAESVTSWTYEAPPNDTTFDSRYSQKTGKTRSSEETRSSAAQEIIAQYRSSQRVAPPPAPSRSSWMSDATTNTATSAQSLGTTIGDEQYAKEDIECAHPALWPGLQAKFRQSQYEELASAQNEAFSMMKQCSLGLNDKITCQRPGCGNTVNNVRSLAFHLHVHNMQESSYRFACKHCQARFETEKESEKHTCTIRSKELVKPVNLKVIRVGFRNVFTKITCCGSDPVDR